MSILNELEAEFQAIRGMKYIAVGLTTVFAYEYMATVDEEVGSQPSFKFRTVLYSHYIID